MQKLQWYTLQELAAVESIPLVKCMGKVKSIQSKPSYFSFVINDGKNQLEATIYEDEKQYSILELPNKNQCVIVVGNAYRREITGKNSIVKVKVRSYRVISGLDEQKVLNRILQSQKSRQEAQQSVGISTKTKRSLVKQLKSVINPVQMRSLILGCVYMTLENNQDLNSYTFSLYTVQKHRLTKSFIQSKKLKEESIEYLSEFIDAQLKYLVEHKLIEQKEKLQQQKIYVVYRDLFTNFQMRILGIINQRQKTGTILSDLVSILNKEEGFVEQRNYIINDNLVQKMLRKFLDDFRIYKTSEKILYPNS